MRIFQSLTHTVLAGLLIFAALLIAVSLLLSRETGRIHQQAMNDHGFLSLLNTVLEVRRYEKSYLIYHEKSAFESTLSYLDQTDRQLREHRGAILSRPDGAKIFQQMGNVAVEYRDRFLSYPMLLEHDPKAIQALEITLHQLGKQLIGLAEQLAADTEDNITVILQDLRISIVVANLFFLGLLILYGMLLLRRAVVPLQELQEGLSSILEGRRDQLEPLCRDREIVALSRMINLTLKTIGQNREERCRQAQFVYSDEVLSRLVKTLEKPMANISTTCQILVEEEPENGSRDLLVRIWQQAEQGGRLLTAIQQYAYAQDKPSTPILLSLLLDRVVSGLQQTVEAGMMPRLEVGSDLVVIGNPGTLERGLSDWMLQVLSACPRGAEYALKARRLSEADRRAALERSVLRPLVWLSPDCHEVVEISLPWTGELPSTPEQPLQDVSWLCLPEEEGNPGICLLPGIIRRHGGAMVVESMAESGVRFALWLPAGQERERKRATDPVARER
ncbi:MAG: hypothetical protein HQL99_00965 [Magnetococcales bacterium]|nr:hypothetical protein [Magnetococcales bacterium]